MKTVVLEKPGVLRLTDAEPPGPPGPTEAVVRVHRVGICGTDLHAFEGKQSFFSYPRILGHELGVEVVALGAAARELGLQEGDRCAVEPYLNCGRCSACRRGRPNCCLSLEVLGVQTDGGMRELVKVPASKLHPSRQLSYDELALVETLCIGSHAASRAGLQPPETVLVIGAGPIGLAVIQAVQAVGLSPIVMEIVDSRLEFCRRELGVELTVDGRRGVEDQLRSLLAGELPTVVFDATGSAASMMAAFRYVAHGGRLIFVGLYRGDITFHDPDFHLRELTLYASRNATAADFCRVMAAVEAGRVNLRPWITHRSTPECIPSEFSRWLDPSSGVIKAVLEM